MTDTGQRRTSYPTQQVSDPGVGVPGGGGGNGGGIIILINEMSK